MTTNGGEVARIRVSLTTGEFEIEGSETFVSQYADSIGYVLQRLLEDGPSVPVPAAAPVITPVAAGSGSAPTVSSADEPFGQVLHSFTSKSGTDQILLAGYFHAKTTSDGTFATNEAHKLLIEQGIKLSNASQSMKNNLTSKRAFKVGSRFKIAKTGLDYLNTLGVSES
jgi:ABC-type uncharacterized transport system permease subunit